MQVSEHTVGLEPQEIGRRALRLLTILALVVVALNVTTAVLAANFDIPYFPGSDYWVIGLFVASWLLGVLLLIGPGVAFLAHSLKHRDEGVTRRLRYAATASTVVPGFIAVLLILSGETPFPTVGWVLVALAAAVVVRAWTARKAEANAGSYVLRSGYSLVGLVVVFLTAARPHGHSPEKAYMTAMKSDLRNLVSAEESFFEENKRYTVDLVELGFKSSPDVNAPQIVVVPSGWHATTSHRRLKKVTCGIAVSTTNPVIGEAGDGEPACK